MRMFELKAARGMKKKKKRLGRGVGSGRGKTSGRGHKGQKARSGASLHLGFEGGQMPLIRRIPKKGFTSKFKKKFQIVNLDVLNRLPEGFEVTPQSLRERNIVKGQIDIKILGEGKLTKPFKVKAHSFSRSAIDKIAKAGGKSEVIK